MGEAKKCVVLYKSATYTGSSFLYGHCFDDLQPCCEAFKTAFFGTGNEKRNDWKGDFYDGKSGLNLLRRGDEFVLTVTNGQPIKFCPWCGAAIEVRHSKRVELRHRTKTVNIGLEEITS